MLAFSNDYYGIIFRATQSVELFCAYFVSSIFSFFLNQNIYILSYRFLSYHLQKSKRKADQEPQLPIGICVLFIFSCKSDKRNSIVYDLLLYTSESILSNEKSSSLLHIMRNLRGDFILWELNL